MACEQGLHDAFLRLESPMTQSLNDLEGTAGVVLHISSKDLIASCVEDCWDLLMIRDTEQEVEESCGLGLGY